jgi:hypothetical protein
MFDLTLVTVAILKVLACFLIIIVIAAMLGIIVTLLEYRDNNKKGGNYNDSNKR